jgi:hypothetical protein
MEVEPVVRRLAAQRFEPRHIGVHRRMSLTPWRQPLASPVAVSDEMITGMGWS